MTPLHLHILAPDPETAERIERTLHTGDPGCVTQVVTDSHELLQRLGRFPSSGGVAVPPSVSPALRHELNNHLALIRMLADLLAEAPGLSPLYATKAREIGLAAEAAALAIRRAHNSSSPAA